MITFRHVLRSEWTKLVSLRSTWATLGTVAVLTVGLAGAIGYGVSRSDPPANAGEAVGAAFLPLDFFVLVIGVLGVLQMTGEYGSGLIRATLTAVPRRLPVLAAKALALAALTFPVMLVVCPAAFLVCQAFIGEGGASLGDPGVPGAILGAAACPVLVGLLGLGVGALVRHTAGAVTALAAALLVIPALLTPVLPGDWDERVMKFVPTIAGQAMYAVGGDNTPFETLAPAASAAVLVAWVLVALAGGAALLARRDA
ncbi:ABC transporter permease subunit [Phytohabitans aurantiacus]|jgi:ABC-2 type transport system permease protein|uniref:ABC transporter permease n=1 Tax=Phytohabitans aurantiacus TaxID=3016789 RepID=A0ABQ5QRL2_9ACTN|nr:ABC transporter permease subunit [Phytohabitans aurantiacus]GLH97255.1 ABC transporter permease [Phytohabitans aurantiacus]